MSSAAMSRIAACPEYQRLLDSCQTALGAWQQRQSSAQRRPLTPQRVQQLRRLQQEYAEAYAMLENHERLCQTCQYISKVGGLDFESMSSALNYTHRF